MSSLQFLHVFVPMAIPSFLYHQTCGWSSGPVSKTPSLGTSQARIAFSYQSCTLLERTCCKWLCNVAMILQPLSGRSSEAPVGGVWVCWHLLFSNFMPSLPFPNILTNGPWHQQRVLLHRNYGSAFWWHIFCRKDGNLRFPSSLKMLLCDVFSHCQLYPLTWMLWTTVEKNPTSRPKKESKEE